MSQIKQTYPFRIKSSFFTGLSLHRLMLCSILAPLFGLFLNFLYHHAGPSGSPLWKKAFFVNFALALCVLLISRFRNLTSISTYLTGNPLTRRGVICFVPGVAILFAVTGSLLSGDLRTELIKPDLFHWSLIFIWIPVVEELVFRLGLSSIIGKFLNPVWGSYFSVLIFSWLHSNPSIDHIFSGESGLIAGPLLLGACCEGLKYSSGSILPAISLHIACNTSAILFIYGDGGWFKPFLSLYM